VPALLAVILQVPIASIVRAPDDGLTLQIKGVDEAKTVVPVFAGEVVALTECVPGDSPKTAIGRFPKVRLSGATRFTFAEFEE
jgi:hypothetical protein